MSEGASATDNKSKASDSLVATQEREDSSVVPAYKLPAELKTVVYIAK